MQLKGKIEASDVNVKSGTSRAGKAYSIREQSMLVQLPNGEARRMSINLEDNEAPLPAGEYEAKDSAFYFAKYGVEVSFRSRHWQRVEAPAVRKVG
jgi:hypothetical protein